MVPLRCILASLGALLVMKTLEDEWYIVIKACMLTVFRDFFVSSLHIESTESVIMFVTWESIMPSFGYHKSCSSRHMIVIMTAKVSPMCCRQETSLVRPPLSQNVIKVHNIELHI